MTHSRTPLLNFGAAIAGVALALAAGCSSAPPVRYHTLMPDEVPQRAAGAGQAGGAATISVVLETIRVPAQVDQPQWLVRLPEGSLAVLEQDRWASPLRDEMRQALLEALNARYGVTEARNAPGVAPLRVALDVRRFDSVPGQEVRIEGSWTIVSGEGGKSSKQCEWFYREPAAAGMQPLAAAHRRAWARLGDALGEGLVRASRNEVVACPGIARSG